MADKIGRILNRLTGLGARAAGRLPLGAKTKARARALRGELDRLADPDGSWGNFVSALDERYVADSASFSDADKRRMFKDMVRLVEFEPHAYCNRLCPFCPNVDRGRIKNWTPMDFSTYRRAIDDLASIDYDQTIRFARYSEPLACKTIFDYVSTARAALPRANLDIVTNGDYLDVEMLSRLVDAGLSALRISIYPKGYAWDAAAARDQFGKLLSRIEREGELLVDTPERLYWRIPHPELRIFAEAADLVSLGFDRGQSLEDLVDRDYVRKSPCAMVFNNVTIDFNGAVMPCCNLRSDTAKHEGYVVDVISGNRSIFDVYASKTMTEWRRSLLRVDPKKDPCRTCKQKTIEDPVALALLDRDIARRLRA
jgi:radical SAM protein with 4Fe4S-binding SPASM domain